MLARPQRIAAALALAAAAGVAPGYVPYERSAGRPLVRADPEAVVYAVHAATRPGLRNAAGNVVITADSTPTASIRAAMATWSGIEGARVGFAPLTNEPEGRASVDGRNLITFADTPENRSLVFGAIAVTRLFGDGDGRLTDTDIVFSPELTFSTTLAAGTFDIEGVLVHELGHALGADHSTLATAAMFATAQRASKRQRRLTEDDRAFARETYPDSGGAQWGAIEGAVRRAEGTAVQGASVTGWDRRTNVTIGVLTGRDGRFRMGGLPPGEYALAAEPLDGLATAFQFASSRWFPDTAFRGTVLGGAAAPATLVVVTGPPAQADLTVDAGAALYRPRGFGGARAGGEIATRAGADLERGGLYRVELHGDGLDDPDIGLASLSIAGAGLRIDGAALERDTFDNGSGGRFPRLRFGVQVDAQAPLGVANLTLTTAHGTMTLPGAIRIVEPVASPRYSDAGMVHAASFLEAPLAPGSLASIFGEELAGSVAAAEFDPLTGRLSDLLAGVSVRVNGVPAPLLFAGPGQINFQTPVETEAGQAFVTVNRDGVAGAPVLVRVAAASPGLFQAPAGGALALNQDGTINGPERRARRGEFVTLFGAGAGSVTPASPTGAPAAVAPLSETVAAVEVLLGGRPATVTFAGLAPGYVGLLQVNARLPDDAPAGEHVPLLVRVGGVAASLSSLAID